MTRSFRCALPFVTALAAASCAASGAGPASGATPPDESTVDGGGPETGVAAAATGSTPSARPAGAPTTVVQPGAPGEATRTIDAESLEDMGGVEWTEADVRFMQGMIPHHAQALEMTALVPSRASGDAVRQMALRMEISQRDEIALMSRWLRERDQDVPEWNRAMDHAAHAEHDMMGGMPRMPGMLSPEQMAELRAATGPEFDRLFLESMIQHHEGAIVMVRDLFTARGGGQESEIFTFASHVDADQTAEIQRMRAVLRTLP